MKVTLKLSGGFVHTVGFSRKELEVEPGTTIGDILQTIAIDRTRPMLIARNGWVVHEDEPDGCDHWLESSARGTSMAMDTPARGALMSRTSPPTLEMRSHMPASPRWP